jgi:Rod binding domain-containing protein
MKAISAAISLTGQPPENARTVKAAQDFEAVLLNAAFADLEAAFTNLPGKPLSSSTKAYDGIAMQALSSGLARGGGIGLGVFVRQWLDGHQESGVRLQAPGVRNSTFDVGR